MSLGLQFQTKVLEAGTFWRVTAPYTPAQDPAERAGALIILMARTMLIYSGLPVDLWPEAIAAAAYIINRLPTKRLGWKTPFEAATSRLPSLAYIRVYSYRAYYHLKVKAVRGPFKAPPKTSKMDPRAHIGYLVGWDSTNVFRIWVPLQNKIL
jgi:hypothetical protein